VLDARVNCKKALEVHTYFNCKKAPEVYRLSV